MIFPRQKRTAEIYTNYDGKTKIRVGRYHISAKNRNDAEKTLKENGFHKVGIKWREW